MLDTQSMSSFLFAGQYECQPKMAPPRRPKVAPPGIMNWLLAILVVFSLSTYSNVIQLWAHPAQEYLGLLLGHFLPAIRSFMVVPVSQGLLQGGSQLVWGLKPAALQGQGGQLLPPGLDEVQLAGILGDELDLKLRPGQQPQLNLPAGVYAQVIFDDQPPLCRKLGHYLFQKPQVTGAVPTVTKHQLRLPTGGFKGSVDPQFAPASIVGFKGGPLWPKLPLLARVGLHRQGSQFIHADHPGTGGWCQVSLDDAPLFSTNCGSWRWASWNQLCWRFHSNPSSASQVQMVESERWMPARPSKAICNRSKVHSWYGYPRVRGFWKARLTSLLRVSSLCTRGWPGRGSSCSPARPCWLNRLTHNCPEKSPLYPARRPALAAESLGSASIPWMTLARGTSRTGAVRDRTNRAISPLSFSDTSRKRNFLGISSSHNLVSYGKSYTTFFSREDHLVWPTPRFTSFKPCRLLQFSYGDGES